MADSILTITIGSTSYAFPIVGPVGIRLKPQTGEIRRQTGRLLPDDIIDNPWTIEQLQGIGVELPTLQTPNADEWAFDMDNLMCEFGYWCMGPLKNTPTQTSPPTTFKALGEGFTEANANLFMFGSVANSGQQPLWYLNGTTLTSCALNGVASIGDQVKIVGVGVFGGTYYAIGNQLVSNGTWNRVSYVGTALATWAQLTTAGASETFGTGVDSLLFLDVTDRAGAAYLNALGYIAGTSTIVFTYRPVTAATTAWTSGGLQQRGGAADATIASITDSDGPPRGFLPITAGDGGLDYLVTSNRGIFHVNMANTAVVSKAHTFRNPSGSYTGTMCMGGDGKVYFADGPTFGRFWFLDNNNQSFVDYPEDRMFSKIRGYAGFTSAKQGHVTRLVASKSQPWVYIFRGGLAATKTAWVMIFNYETEKFRSVPYLNATAQRALMAGIEFSDALWLLEEQAAGGDQDAFYFVDITLPPKQTSGYTHAASAKLCLSKSSRYLPTITGSWRSVSVTGSGLTSNNKVTAVYASADAAVMGTDGSSWGSTLGAITATGGSVNFAATPAGTGQSAAAMQVRLDLAGASNASPYIDTISIGVKKQPADKFIRTFIVDLQGGGSVMPSDLVLSNLETVLASSTDLSVSYSNVSAKVMEPYKLGGQAVSYTDDPSKSGTVQYHLGVKYARLVLVDV